MGNMWNIVVKFVTSSGIKNQCLDGFEASIPVGSLPSNLQLKLPRSEVVRCRTAQPSYNTVQQSNSTVQYNKVAVLYSKGYEHTTVYCSGSYSTEK